MYKTASLCMLEFPSPASWDALKGSDGVTAWLHHEAQLVSCFPAANCSRMVIIALHNAPVVLYGLSRFRWTSLRLSSSCSALACRASQCRSCWTTRSAHDL